MVGRDGWSDGGDGPGGETLGEMIKSEPEKGARRSSVEDDFRLEMEPEYPSDDCSADELAEDGWWSPVPTQPYFVESGVGIQRPMEKRSPGSQGEQLSHDEAAVASGKPHVRQSSCFTGAKRRKLRGKPERTKDQEWEEARQDAWLRQMLSETSSDEDEERYVRFAESGRWVSELFKIPQHLAATSGGECSGQKKPEYS